MLRIKTPSSAKQVVSKIERLASEDSLLLPPLFFLGGEGGILEFWDSLPIVYFKRPLRIQHLKKYVSYTVRLYYKHVVVGY